MTDRAPSGLNESPSEKEGKTSKLDASAFADYASMKVPPKRKGKATRK